MGEEIYVAILRMAAIFGLPTYFSGILLVRVVRGRWELLWPIRFKATQIEDPEGDPEAITYMIETDEDDTIPLT